MSDPFLRVRARWLRSSVVAAALLFVAESACAQGLTGSLGALRAAYFLFWGALGIVPAILLAIAFVIARRKGATWVSYLLTVPAVFYAPVAISLIFFPSNDFASKIPGVVGFCLLFGLVFFYVTNRYLLRWVVSAVLGAVAITLMLIPNAYWEVPLLSFERVEYVDNVAPREVVGIIRSRSAPSGWLALEDGRHLIQQADGVRRNSSGKPAFPSGDVVVLEATTGPAAGQWFEIIYFRKNYRYAMSQVSLRARYVIPLSTRFEDMYKPSGTSLGVLLDGTAELDYRRMLGELLRSENGWSIDPDPGDRANVAYWLGVLTELADVDVNSPEFLTPAYRRKGNYYRFLVLIDAGVDPNSVNNSGNAMLHIAARDGDVHSIRWLLQHGADPQLTNRWGQRPLDLARKRYKRSPLTTQIKTIETLLQQDSGGSDSPDG